MHVAAAPALCLSLAHVVHDYATHDGRGVTEEVLPVREFATAQGSFHAHERIVNDSGRIERAARVGQVPPRNAGKIPVQDFVQLVAGIAIAVTGGGDESRYGLRKHRVGSGRRSAENAMVGWRDFTAAEHRIPTRPRRASRDSGNAPPADERKGAASRPRENGAVPRRLTIVVAAARSGGLTSRGTLSRGTPPSGPG